MPAQYYRQLFDRTSSRDYPSRTICASTTSFGPFYVARKDERVRPLFDKSKAYKRGSTIPVKLQMVNANGVNVSSSSLVLSARGLRLIGGNTQASVTDSGNANANGKFRYDSQLQDYIYNLSTKGLASGKYALSFYAGNERSFFFSVEFEVK